MTDLVNPDEIERIVGVERHPTRHYARAVSAEQRVYILHSQQCRDRRNDLRDCLFSQALDNGIDECDWSNVEDQPVRVSINRSQRLIPVRPGMRFATDVVEVGIRYKRERNAARSEVEALTARLVEQRERIARDIEEARLHFLHFTQTPAEHPIARAYEETANIARGGTDGV